VLGKNFELIIKMKLEVTANNIPNYQFGFKENHSPVNYLVNNVQENKKVGKKSAALFLDINKAFDSIWHKGLLYKLFKLNCPKYLVSIVKNYLEDRTLSVRINNHVSEEFKPEQGVPRGSPLAPILYNIYCHDIYNFRHKEGNYLNSQLYILQYADDTVLISHSNNLVNTTEQLESLVEPTVRWFRRWRLKPNPKKSQLLYKIM
jgi:hypothetical protein